MHWLVELETASPDNGIDIQEALKTAIQILGIEVTQGTFDNNGWNLQLDIEAEDSTEALEFAELRTVAVNELARLPKWPIVAVHVRDAEYVSTSCRGFEPQ
jgi:N12 class adenine-specific DNA methylase